MVFLDAMLQTSILGNPQRTLCLPTRITSIHIDPALHQQKVYSLKGDARGRPTPSPCRLVSLCRALPTLTHLFPQWST